MALQILHSFPTLATCSDIQPTWQKVRIDRARARRLARPDEWAPNFGFRGLKMLFGRDVTIDPAEAPISRRLFREAPLSEVEAGTFHFVR